MNISQEMEGDDNSSLSSISSHGSDLRVDGSISDEDRTAISGDKGDFEVASTDCFLAENPSVATPHLRLQISSPDVKIQVCSDLHLEFFHRYDSIPDDIIIPNAPILALLGDVGLAKTDLLKRFLHLQAERFEHVLVLSGNHEYYNSENTQYTVSEQFTWLQEVCSEKNHFLERTTVEINNVAILGTTLWSRIPRGSAKRAQMSMNDYHQSYTKSDTTLAVNDRTPKWLEDQIEMSMNAWYESKASSAAEKYQLHLRLTVKDTNYQFQKSLTWLEAQIEKYSCENKSIIVLTHHAPITEGVSNPVYKDSELNCCFSTNLSHLLKHPVKYWACGHTHWNFDMVFDNGNTRLVSNQRGYPGRDHSGYDNEGLILTV